MHQLQVSGFIDDDPTLIDFIKHKPSQKALVTIYNINERSLAKSQRELSPTRYSPDRTSRLSVYSMKKQNSEDRGFRVRTSSTMPLFAKCQSTNKIDLTKLKQQMLESTVKHPSLARFACERFKVLNSSSQRLARIKNPMRGTLKKSLLTLRASKREQPTKPNLRLKTNLLGLIAVNPFTPHGYNEYI